MAQLVARFLHTEEVIGSSPVSPTENARNNAGTGDQTTRKHPPLLISVMHRAVDQNLIDRNPINRTRMPRMMRNKHPVDAALLQNPSLQDLPITSW